MEKYKFSPYKKIILVRDSVCCILQNHAFFHIQTTFSHMQRQRKTTIMGVEMKLAGEEYPLAMRIKYRTYILPAPFELNPALPCRLKVF